MTAHKIRNVIIFVIIIIVTFGKSPIVKSQSAILFEDIDKSKYVALNLIYLAAPGGGFGLEGGLPIGDKYRNLSFAIRFCKWAVPHGEHKGDEGYDYPSLVRAGFGICYFPGMKLHKGFFTSDNLTFTRGEFSDPESNAYGSFVSMGTVWEIGYRWLYKERWLIQASFGLGWSFAGKVDISNKEQTTLGSPLANKLNADAGLLIGWAF